MTDFIKAWSPILIPLLGLLAGSGWLQYYLNQRHTKREKFRTLLEDFLLPFEGTLNLTRKVFNELLEGLELERIEFHPSELQRFFASLPNQDPRKLLWKSRIELLQTENRHALELIDRFYGRIILRSFKEACDEFRKHIKEWEDMWKELLGSETVSSPLRQSEILFAPQFPIGLEKALQEELAEVRRCAGQ